MARDCYDDCIAYLDDQLGRLLDELQGQGLLEDTMVIITADHGESFGDHGMFLHPTSLYLDQTHVPLVILSPDAPAGRVVAEPVSLRDLPATVVDRLGLSAGSPFPGRSLAAYWSATPGEATSDHAPVLSEYTTPAAFRPQSQKELGRRGVQMSLVAEGRHYIRDGLGSEQLYDLKGDRSEGLNLMNTPEGQRARGSLSPDAPRHTDGQPRHDRAGKCLPEAVPAVAQIPARRKARADPAEVGDGRAVEPSA